MTVGDRPGEAVTLYLTADDRLTTSEEIVRAYDAHRNGPARVRVLCRCGEAFWGDTEQAANAQWVRHSNGVIGYPLTAISGRADLSKSEATTP